jgi:hypothetical protein
MALEIPNAIAAAGTFAPTFGPAPGTIHVPIPSSVGFEPYDPTTTALNPKGGFTRTVAGNYLMQLVESIDVLEGVLVTSVGQGGAGDHVLLSAIIPNLAPFNPDSNFVGVETANAAGAAADVAYYQSILFRYATGPKFDDVIA